MSTGKAAEAHKLRGCCALTQKEKSRIKYCHTCITNRETFTKIKKKTCVCLPRRYVVALMLFIGGMTFTPHRVNIGVTIVAMIGNSTNNGGNVTFANQESDVFDWSPQIRGFILSSFFYGYLFLQVPAGYLALRHGGHYPLAIAAFISSILCIVTPISARQHPYLLVMIRFAQGLVQGFTTPVYPAILERWSPLREKSLIATLSMSGLPGGILVGTALAGVLTDALGWPSVFYIQGSLSLVWCLLWLLLISESPEEDPSIDEEELNLFRKEVVCNTRPGLRPGDRVPWKKIFTSGPVWAIIINLISFNWLILLILSEIPSYLNKVHGYSVSSIGLFAALPYVLQATVGPASGLASDVMRRKGLSTTAVRKIVNSIGFAFYALFYITVAFNNSSTGAVIALVIGVGFSSICFGCTQVNHIDVARRYSSLILSLGNCAGILAGASTPLFVGFVVKNETSAEWRTVFLTSAAVAVVNIVIYLIFGSGEHQAWSDSREISDIIEKGQSESLV